MATGTFSRKLSFNPKLPFTGTLTSDQLRPSHAMSSLQNSDIYRDIKARVESKRHNELVIEIGRTVLVAYSQRQLSSTMARTVVSSLVEQKFYRDKIRKAYEAKDFQDLGPLC
jgi:hypothetical protein